MEGWKDFWGLKGGVEGGGGWYDFHVEMAGYRSWISTGLLPAFGGDGMGWDGVGWGWW